MVRNTPIEGYIACCQAIAKLNLTDRLPGIAILTLVVVGADDPATTVDMGKHDSPGHCRLGARHSEARRPSVESRASGRL